MRKPSWLKTSLRFGEHFLEVKVALERLGLHTVCQEAACPNVGECWGRGTATFMILGDVCTRACRFCNVTSGLPSPPNEEEPNRVAEAVKALSLHYCVITSVTRDDLPDGGANHFSATVQEIKKSCPQALVEVLIPDFGGSYDSLQIMVDSGPDVVAHNVETVERLTPVVRDQRTNYQRSLSVLKGLKEINSGVLTKSGFMVGLRETEDEVLATMQDLRDVGCNILTIGQYLQPSMECVPVVQYVHPDKFEEYKVAGESMGFHVVASGPLVRSSYLADQYFRSCLDTFGSC